jgi:uncharacterized protein YybS (DUF2232 family)
MCAGFYVVCGTFFAVCGTFFAVCTLRRKSNKQMENLIVRNWLAFGAHLITLIGVIIIFALTKPKSQLELFREGVPPPEPGAANAFDPKCDIN